MGIGTEVGQPPDHAPDPSPDVPVAGPPALDDVVRAIEADPAALESVARRAAGDEDARLLDWSVDQLAGGRGGNPTSGGIFRVSGRVAVGPREGQGFAAWSAVLKVVRSPVETGDPMDSPGEAFFWRREVDVLRAGLLDDIDGVRPPRLYGVVERRGEAWLWLEDLGPSTRSPWRRADYERAARALARFGAPYLTGTPLPEHPSLSREFLREFRAEFDKYLQVVLARVRALGDAGSGLDPDRADGSVAAVVRLVVDPEPLLAALDTLPRTLCHGDANVDNVVVRRRPDGGTELVMIDWQTVGPGVVGGDLGQLLANIPAEDRTARDELEAAVLRAYHDELTAAGVRVDPAAIRRGYVGDHVIRMTSWNLWLLHGAMLEVWDDDAAVTALLDDFLRTTAVGPLPALAAEIGAWLEEGSP